MVGCEGGYDMHEGADPIVGEILEDDDARGSSSQGWSEPENSKEIY